MATYSAIGSVERLTRSASNHAGVLKRRAETTSTSAGQSAFMCCAHACSGAPRPSVPASHPSRSAHHLMRARARAVLRTR